MGRLSKPFWVRDRFYSMRRIRLTISAVTLAIVLAGCGSGPTVRSASTSTPQAAAIETSPTPTPAVSSPSPPRPGPTPTAKPCPSSYPLPGLCVGQIGRVPTAAEFAAMKAVGAPAIEKSLGMKDWSACSNGQSCFKAGTLTAAMVGSNAAVFDGGFGLFPGGGGGAACWVFLSKDSSAWHYVNSGCAQNPGLVPGSFDSGAHVSVTGCANFRDAATLSSKILGCLGNGTVVGVDSAPVYQDGHIWWHLAGRGWMAHDYLCQICRP
jgi:hypothetical protein